jgi:protein-tyrosine phosphatase
VIDLHTHLLPGVDDGSPSVAVSAGVLKRFAAEGVDVVACTPHLDASAVGGAPYERHAEILQELAEGAPDAPSLRLGWEIMLDVPGAMLTSPQLWLGGAPAVLVEFPRTQVPTTAAAELFRIRMSGVVPLVAHPERYWGCTPEMVVEWRRVGAAIQMDATMLLGRTPMAKLARELLEEGLADIFASDNHGDSRNLAGPRRWLEELGAADQAELLTDTNPRRLLAGEPLLPVPPIPRERGMIGRLRELVLGRR